MLRVRQGVSLIEILAALFLLAVAIIPIIGLIGSGAADVDILNSSLFAQTAARGILETTLEAVPFDFIGVSEASVADLGGGVPEANVGRLLQTGHDDSTGLLGLLGNSGEDSFMRGTLRDERGILYKIKLFVFPVPAEKKSPAGDVPRTIDSTGATSLDAVEGGGVLAFSFLPRPPFEQARDARGRPVWYTADQFVGEGVLRPYDIPVATVTRYAADLGVPEGNDLRFPRCVMKKLLLRIRWAPRKGPERAIELVTAKADLSRSGNEK
ncbi:MAG: hypothetical protein HQM09_23080 [Candidatus Riflebacteria bacterium]|nr:hypothetical protein [Candidatus Riflebacteria bacterium]